MEWFEHAIGGSVILNVQTSSLGASLAAHQLLGRAVFVGVMARDYPNLADGAAYIGRLHEAGIQVSAGLGDGSPDEWERALQLALAARPPHLNQIFSAAALSQFALRREGAHTVVNAMIRPAGEPGIVSLGTGPLSGRMAGGVRVPADAAIAMMCEMGIVSVKLFPIEGDLRLDEVRAVARAVAAADMMLEPTGGITPDNVARVVDACLAEGVRCVMPHLYGSLKDPSTNDLDIARLERAAREVERLFAGSGA
ncbi:KDGP aldolase [Paenibacillus cymbidii]|uniref:KDGP aldolase n=1 Tax=Paenibacillus cymbidii TaxID=1639034 RepID=UPI0010816DDB|nr:KDGP aldolase [Paenibacillus cymbidii]